MKDALTKEEQDLLAWNQTEEAKTWYASPEFRRQRLVASARRLATFAGGDSGTTAIPYIFDEEIALILSRRGLRKVGKVVAFLLHNFGNGSKWRRGTRRFDW